MSDDDDMYEKPTLRVFDIDGTIYDTFLKNKAAYEDAGLPFEYTRFHFANNRKHWPEEVPEEVFAKKAKIQGHLDYMMWVVPGPAHDLFFSTPDMAVTLTGATWEAVEALEVFFEEDLCCIGAEHTKEMKLERLRGLAANYNVVYYEDDLEIARWMGMNGINCVWCNPKKGML